jgi:hypothetical protein
MWHGKVGEFCELSSARTIRAIVLRRCRDSLTSHEKKDGSAWETALYAVADALRNKGFNDHELVVEARMPNNNARADFVILGTNANGARSLVALELKMWNRCKATRLGRVGLGNTQDSSRHMLHPCWQVMGYRDQMKLYADALVDHQPASVVNGMAYLPALKDTNTLQLGDTEAAEQENRKVVAQCPAFGTNDCEPLTQQLHDWLPSPPDGTFVQEFLQGKRRADKSLKDMAEHLLLHWPLIDQQMDVALAVEERVGALAARRDDASLRRTVVLITGGPGSGKTLLAVWILLRAIAKAHLVNSAFVTTSRAHNDAIAGEMQLQQMGHLLPPGMQSDLPVFSARDRAMKYHIPGFQSKQKAENSGHMDQGNPDWWKEYCRSWLDRFDPAVGADKPEYDVLVCDEAQALINVERDAPYARAAGWVFSSGPQAAHLIRKARLSVFLMDNEQGYRDVESTTPDDIVHFAKRVGVNQSNIHHFHLEGLQFRLSGNEQFLTWLDCLFDISEHRPTSCADPQQLQDVFQVYDCPATMRDDLRTLHDNGEGPCRLLAGYGWKWVSRNESELVDSHDGLGDELNRKPPPGIRFRWLYPEEKQQAFNLGQPPFDNPDTLFGVGEAVVAHVGYPLVVRGRDFEHVGVMWPMNLVRRNGDGGLSRAYFLERTCRPQWQRPNMKLTIMNRTI